MPSRFRLSEGWSTISLRVLAALLAGAIFVLDTVTPREIAMAVFYVAVVLIAMRFLPPRGVTLVACACIALSIISYALTPRGSPEAGLWNLAIAVTAILVATYLARKLVAAEAAAHEAKAQLARVTRIAAIGELTASIAHEVNQPLTAVIASGDAGTRWLATDPPNVARAQRALERMIGDAKRASEIVGRVRAMASGAPTQKRSLALNGAVRRALALLFDEFNRLRISVQVDLDERLPAVGADPVQVQQVLINLLTNAGEALAAVDDRPRELVIVTARDDGHLLVRVSDNGPGLGASNPEEIFDAFVTRKPGGMGIGLSLSRSIIERHGGRITAIPNAPFGLTVQFSLPIDKGDAHG
ncbi:MAG: two-component sensor histidine kinase [Proteobacteria bacterium]|nr:two-component sensor histidine kinase [Pseudomonadota bacterium]